MKDLFWLAMLFLNFFKIGWDSTDGDNLSSPHGGLVPRFGNRQEP